MKPKGRPRKPRKVQKEPQTRMFSPRGRRGRPDEVELKIEELEAIRLADIEAFKQKDAAQSMGISRQSFGRVLQRGRRTVANALILGKIIRIEGGSYKIQKRPEKGEKS